MSEADHAADSVLGLHQLEAAVDLLERELGRHERVDVDLAGEVAVDELRDLIGTIRSSGGVERARDRARGFHDAAVGALERLPDRPERTALREIADFILYRER